MSTSRPVTLYHRSPSHYCEKARRILEWKKIPFTIERVPYHDPRALLAVSGQDYVPYLATAEPQGGVTWPDIADWAERVAPTPTLYPTGRAEARVIEHWAHIVVEEATWKVALPEIVRAFSDPVEAWVFEEMQAKKRGPLEVMKARRPEFLAEMTGVLGLVEDMLASHPFVLGDAPSVADFALYGAMRPLELAGHEIPQEFQRTRAWYLRTATV